MDQKPPRPSSVSSLPKRDIRYVELGAGQDYQLSALEVFRVVDGDVSVHLVISAGAEPVFCYDVGKGGIVHPEMLVDPFELPGALRLVALKRTKLEVIPATEFRADYSRMVGNGGPLAYFRPMELAEIREAALKTFFRIANALRDAIASAEQSRRDRRMSAAKASMSQMAHTTTQGFDPAFKKRFAQLFAAMFELEAGDVENLMDETTAFMAKGQARAEQPSIPAHPSIPEPPPPRGELSTLELTGPDGFSGLIPVTDEEGTAPPAWPATEPTSDIHNRLTPINVPPPTTQPSPKASAIGQASIASRRSTLPFVQIPLEPAGTDTDRPANPPPAPSVRIEAPRQASPPETPIDDFDDEDFDIIDGKRVPKRSTSLGLDPTSNQWGQVHRSSAPPAPKPPPPSNPKGGLGSTLSGVGGRMPPQSAPRPPSTGSPPKPPPLPPRSR